ncbi:GlsB/YeaQ/YmgE family stress response membrane protein [Comamonas sp. w2-DMI]|uniref:GlsB/YeaQ/YmgE family stress response membrane protein n=1 Tax=Comamonas terrae TaxID=673548 RepID=A0ABW5US82_9BURK|nr:GlsB/YeaQ/YmgE family stress response membrane protein [Comamonas terrae]
MDFLIWLLVGGLIGWIASMIMRTDAQQGLLLNVIVGVVGALIGGWLITPLLGPQSTINDHTYSAMSIFVSLAGAVILLAIVNLIRRGSSR